VITKGTAGSPARPGSAERAPPAGPTAGTDFVVVDLETTGLSPEEAAITEIGAVRVCGGRWVGQFSSLVNPGTSIPEPAITVTGISDAMASAAPALSQVLPVFLGFAGGAVLAAHNAQFDIGFLTAACEACGLAWPGFWVLDTVALARQVLGTDEVPDCRLATLAGFFATGTRPRHRALPDALATAGVLAGLLARLTAAGVATLPEGTCEYATGHGAGAWSSGT
jgi:DNA polymerase-3 subunit epsilon